MTTRDSWSPLCQELVVHLIHPCWIPSEDPVMTAQAENRRMYHDVRWLTIDGELWVRSDDQVVGTVHASGSWTAVDIVMQEPQTEPAEDPFQGDLSNWPREWFYYFDTDRSDEPSAREEAAHAAPKWAIHWDEGYPQFHWDLELFWSLDKEGYGVLRVKEPS